MGPEAWVAVGAAIIALGGTPIAFWNAYSAKRQAKANESQLQETAHQHQLDELERVFEARLGLLDARVVDHQHHIDACQKELQECIESRRLGVERERRYNDELLARQSQLLDVQGQLLNVTNQLRMSIEENRALRARGA